MSGLRQLGLYLKKNAIQKQRNACQTLCEIATPVILVALFAALYAKNGIIHFADTTYECDLSTNENALYDFVYLSRALNASHTVLGVVGQPVVTSAFSTHVSSVYPGLGPDAVGPNGLDCALLAFDAVNGTQSVPFFPPLAPYLLPFPDEASLEAYVTSSSYGDGDSHPPLFAAVVWTSVPQGDGGAVSGAPGEWAYRIRMNASALPSDTRLSTDDLARGINNASLRAYTYFSQSLPNSPLSLTMPGFVQLQTAVDRFIIGRVGSANDTSADAAIDRLVFLASWGCANGWNGSATGPPGVPAALTALDSFMVSHRYTPQRAVAAPFPTPAYLGNSFYALVQSLFALVFVMAFFVPSFFLIRGLVVEKETKIREGMRMMGMKDGPLAAAWYITYGIIFLFVALFIAITVKSSFFSRSDAGLLFIFFWLFGIASTALCMLLSTFFSQAKIAAVVGAVLFVALFFPYFSVNGAVIAPFLKRAASLAAPVAFGLTIDVLSALEGSEVGVTWPTVGSVVNGYSVADGLTWLALDAIIYAALAAYLGAVLPQEFGVPLPWWFPFSVDYWVGRPLEDASLQADQHGLVGSIQAMIRSAMVIGGMADPLPSATATASTSSISANGLTGKSVAWPGKWLDSSSSEASSMVASLLVHDGGHSDADLLATPVEGENIEPPGPLLRELGRAKRSIAVRGLTKVFSTPDGPKIAVSGLGVDFYEGQISVLLGHNGAGKSTTMAMLTGLLPPSAGDAFVYGASVRTGMHDVRKSLGVCPQHDVLWPDLTVDEHLQFFAGLKGVPPHQVSTAVGEVIRDVGLTEKRFGLAANLSGGQKRKLSVAIALIGGSKFVVLDEPTSGMDPYSRRSTWQILQNAREGRVLLLTTHFMDEADILGDRIAIMADGQIRCCGSSMFLKRRFGVGYNLAIVKAASADSSGIVALSMSHVPSSRVLSDVGAEIVLQVPLDASPAFPALFSDLEAKSSTLGVLSYGISVTTMEEVFLKVAEEGAAALDEAQAGTGAVHKAIALTSSSASGAGTSTGVAGFMSSDASKAKVIAKEQVSAFSVFLLHVRALLIKRWRFATRDRRALFFQLVIPVAALLAGLALLNEVSLATWRPLTLGMGLYNPSLGSFANHIPYASSPSADMLAASMVIASAAAGVSMPGAGLGNATLVPVTGLQSPLDSFTYFEQFPNGSTPECMQVGSAGLPALYLGTANGLATLPDLYEASQWLLLTRNGSEGTGGPGADGSPVESGASRYGAWLLARLNTSVESPYASYSVMVNSTAFHAAPSMVNLVHSALAALLADPHAPITSIAVENAPLPFTDSQRVFVNATTSFISVLFIVIAVSFIPASFANFVTKEREVSAKHQQLISGVSIPAYWVATYAWDMATYAIPCIAAIGLIVGYNTTALVGPALPATICLFIGYGAAVAPFTYVTSFAFNSHSTAQTASLILNLLCLVVLLASYVMKLVPSTCRADAGLRFVYRFLPGYALGDGLLQLTNLPYLALIDNDCGRKTLLESLQQHFTPWSMEVTGWPILYLACEAVGYMLLAIGIDVLHSVPAIRARLIPDVNPPKQYVEEDDDVMREAQRVEDGAPNDLIVMQGLRKTYGGKKVAVRDLSFAVPAGEVFGFLGINGAGKTTTMKMVTGDIIPSEGTAKLGGFDILREQMQVRRLLGYCPQFDALLDLLTVREHLELFARIKGVPETEVAGVVDSKLRELDLVQYEGKLAGSLSGGNKRKLSVAISLIGDPPLVFLDEPSTGMDPVARRKMWRVIERVATRQKQCSIILTTHSMEEAEALCGRIGIMVGGRLRCLGSTQHLKSKFGQGYLAVFKLSMTTPQHIHSVLDLLRPYLVWAEDAAGSTDDLQYMRITVDSLAPACAALGDSTRARMVHPTGTGWALAAELQREGSIAAGTFAEWWASESLAANLHAWVLSTFNGASLVERQGEFLRYRIPAQPGQPLSAVFRLLEARRTTLSILEYSLSQVSLEMIFNTMAAGQDEEQGNARGMVLEKEEGSAVKIAMAIGGAVLTGNPLSLGLKGSINGSGRDRSVSSDMATATYFQSARGSGRSSSPAGISLQEASYRRLQNEENEA